ncbi:hypothetical protein ACN08Z_00775 [Rothia sp. P7181]|uniref:hypothetical protein n=1 Tax=unclassified Rothia (in: high G+C Gram-positive bacteria) TaxID=2689056 RepID=UPI003AD5C7DF
MGNAPRALNRILLTLFGLVFLALGAGLIALKVSEPLAQYWNDAVDQVEQPARDVFAAAATPWGFSWVTVGVVVLAVIAVFLLVRWIFAQHGNRAHSVASSQHSVKSQGSQGRTELAASFAKDAVKESFEQNPDVLSTSVTALKLPKKTSGLFVKVEVRQGANPLSLRETVDKTVAGLDALTGQEIPVTVYLTGGIRAMMSKDTQRVN